MQRCPQTYAILVAVLTLGVTDMLKAADAATVPYRALFRMAELTPDRIDGSTNVPALFTVRSRIPAMRPQDIRLELEVRKGKAIALSVDSHGAFALPISRALYDENPDLVANQPKGTMMIERARPLAGADGEILGLGEDGRVRYADLFAAQRVRDRVLSEMAAAEDDTPAAPPTRVALLAGGAPATRPSARMLLADATRDMPATPGHADRFELEADAALIKLNPWVQLSPQHRWSIQTLGTTETP